MTILKEITKLYAAQQPLKGKKTLVCTHTTPATVHLLHCLIMLGAIVYFWPSKTNQKCSLIKIQRMKQVIRVPNEEFIKRFISKIDFMMEDSARVSQLIYKWAEGVRLKKRFYTIEQTTSGIGFFAERLRLDGKLKYPVVNAGRTRLKLEIENSLVTPQSILQAFQNVCDTMLAGKNVMIIGAGAIGYGLAKLLRSNGAHVTLVETDSSTLTIVESNSFSAFKLKDINRLLPAQDIIISCTANREGYTIGADQLSLMKNHTILFNSGSGTGEFDPKLLKLGSFPICAGKVSSTKVGAHIRCVLTKDNQRKSIKILGMGRSINLHCGNGTCNEVIENIVFSIMVLSSFKMEKNLPKVICSVPKTVEDEVAELWRSADSRTMSPQVIRPKCFHTLSRSYGKLLTSNKISKALRNVDIAKAIFYRGTESHGHYHLITEEIYVIHRGSARITMWHYKKPSSTKRICDVQAGDITCIPVEYVHKVKVTSSVDFNFDVITSPPFSIWDKHYVQNSVLEA